MDVVLPVPSECSRVKVTLKIREAVQDAQPGMFCLSAARLSTVSAEAVVHFIHLESFHSSEGSFLYLEILLLLVGRGACYLKVP